MSQELFLPIHYRLTEGIQLNKPVFSGVQWQIYRTNRRLMVLVAEQELADRWLSLQFIDENHLKLLEFGDKVFSYFVTKPDAILCPIQELNRLETEPEALALAFALKESRKINSEVSFHDSIYSEDISRLLPTWTISQPMKDEEILGFCLTGGVAISILSFRRLKSLVWWMNDQELKDVIKKAGLGIKIDEPTSKCGDVGISDVSFPSHYMEGSKRIFSLPGRPSLQTFFQEYVIEVLLNSEPYTAFGITFPNPVLLYGPPGCGKTYAVDKLIDFLGWPSFSITSGSVGSPYIHETSKKISELFQKAKNVSPSVLIIDELESFLSERGPSASSLSHLEEVAEFLRQIPKAQEQKILVIGMTNKLEMIDTAILRKGRFDHLIEVGIPTKSELKELLQSIISKLPTKNDINILELSDRLYNHTLSDADFIVRDACRIAAKAGKNMLDQFSIDMAMEKLENRNEQLHKKHPIGFSQGDLDEFV